MWYSLFYNNVLDYIKPYIDLDLGSVENNPPPKVPRLLVCPRFTVIKTQHVKSQRKTLKEHQVRCAQSGDSVHFNKTRNQSHAQPFKTKYRIHRLNSLHHTSK